MERQRPAQLPALQETLGHHERVLTKLKEVVEHEHSRRHDFQTTVRRLRTDREKDRSEFAFAQLEKEREIHFLRDELGAARRETALLRDQHENLVRDYKKL